VLDLAGFDPILIETLGVGQDEVDVVPLVDVTVVTLMPGAGDEVQALKAGLMEVADVFAINKADLPGSHELAEDVRAMLGADETSEPRARPPAVILVSAANGEGIAELVDVLDARSVAGPDHSRTGVVTSARVADPKTPPPPTIALDHVAVAVSDPGPVVSVLRRLFDLTVSEPEVLAEHAVTVAFAQTGCASVEIVAPAGSESPLHRFLARRGGGLHHVALRVQNLPRELARLRHSGIRLIDEQPRVGANGSRVAFLHPSSTCGVLIELVEHPIDDRAW
jgi:methylmalonyl-CoA epimerase